jgi:hypothetical protein
MRNIYIVYRVVGSYKYVQSVFSSKKKAMHNLSEIKLEIDIPYGNDGEFLIAGIRWTDENNVINSAYISSEKLR